MAPHHRARAISNTKAYIFHDGLRSDSSTTHPAGALRSHLGGAGWPFLRLPERLSLPLGVAILPRSRGGVLRAGRPMSTSRRLFPVLLALAAGACAASRGDGNSAGTRCLVTLHDYRSGTRLELASESHTDRVAYYSQARPDALRKVQVDPVMEAFADELDRAGFEDHSQAGPAPAIGRGEVVSWGLEVERGGQRTHWLVGPGSAADDWLEFQRCRDAFLELYNATVSYQAVENQEGKRFFEQGSRPAPERSP